MGHISYSFARTKDGVVKGSFAEVRYDYNHDFVVSERQPRELIAPYRHTPGVVMPEKPAPTPIPAPTRPPAKGTREYRVWVRWNSKKV